MVASADIQTKLELGDFNDLPVKASTTIYAGAMVGDDASGYARGLVAGDPFRGHAVEQVTAVSAGDHNVKVRKGVYRLQVAVTGGSAVTDVGAMVYGSADNTYTLTKGSNTPVGRVVRWVTSTTCLVEFCTVIPLAHQHTGLTDAGALTSPLVVTGIKDVSGHKTIVLSQNGSALLAFFSVTPVVKHAHIADTGSVLTSLKTNLNHVIEVLEQYGLLKTS